MQDIILKTFKGLSFDNDLFVLSLVQKYIREEHKIDIEILRSWSVSNGYHYVIKPDDLYENQIIQQSEIGRSYETSLEQALVKCLKMINDR